MDFRRLAGLLLIGAAGLYAASVTVPLGLQPIAWPADNPYTPEKADLGRLLYFDTRLSSDNSVACATCHAPNYAFTDALPVSSGVGHQKGTRNAPTIINGAYGTGQDDVVTKLKAIPGYRTLFAKAFGTEDFTIDHIAKAIATFECHKEAIFSDNAFHNLGTGMDKPDPDLGRFAVTHDPKDWGAFKTPTLRDVAETPPYMHDGSLKTLREVVDLYDKGGTLNKNLDKDIKPLKLSSDHRSDLVEFLRARSGDSWQSVKASYKLPE
jgi:cytochrome c peroxidase